MFRKVLLIVLLFLCRCWLPGVAQVPPRCAVLFRAAEDAGVVGDKLSQALENLQAIRKSPVIAINLNDYVRGGKRLIGVTDGFVPAADAVNAGDWILITANSNIKDMDELAVAIDALANYLQDSGGNPFVGVILKQGVRDDTNRLIRTMRLGNRGHYFEAAGTRNLIKNGVVNRDAVRGMGLRLFASDGTYLVEGDLVHVLGDGRVQFIDFKANGGNFDLDELDRIERALSGEFGTATAQVRSATTGMDQFQFYLEQGSSPPGPWLEKFNAIQGRVGKTRLPDLQFVSFK